MRLVVGDNPVRRSGLEVQPAVVVNVVESLTHLLEVDASLAEQIPAILEMELANQLAQGTDFFQDVADMAPQDRNTRVVSP